METPEIAVDPTCRICLKQEPKELSKTLFWGLGWDIQREHESVMLWHWGDNGVFKAFVMADLGEKVGHRDVRKWRRCAERCKADHRHRFTGIWVAEMKQAI